MWVRVSLAQQIAHVALVGRKVQAVNLMRVFSAVGSNPTVSANFNCYLWIRSLMVKQKAVNFEIAGSSPAESAFFN